MILDVLNRSTQTSLDISNNMYLMNSTLEKQITGQKLQTQQIGMGFFDSIQYLIGRMKHGSDYGVPQQALIGGNPTVIQGGNIAGSGSTSTGMLGGLFGGVGLLGGLAAGSMNWAEGQGNKNIRDKWNNLSPSDKNELQTWSRGDRKDGPIDKTPGGETFKKWAPDTMKKLQDEFHISKEDAAAVMGNIGHESAGMTQSQEKNPRGGGRGGLGFYW